MHSIRTKFTLLTVIALVAALSIATILMVAKTSYRAHCLAEVDCQGL